MKHWHFLFQSDILSGEELERGPLWLRTLAALPDDLSLAPSTHIVTYNFPPLQSNHSFMPIVLEIVPLKNFED